MHSAIDQQIATVIGGNVARRDAMTYGMWAELQQRLEVLSRAPQIRSVIVRSEGDDTFVSGADISEFPQHRSACEKCDRDASTVSAAEVAIEARPTPVIAAICGSGFGAGGVIDTCCDLRVGRPDATFRVPAARLDLRYGL